MTARAVDFEQNTVGPKPPRTIPRPERRPSLQPLPPLEFFGLALFLSGGCGGALLVFSSIIPLSTLVLGNLGFIGSAPYLILDCF